MSAPERKEFKPYVSADTVMSELSVKAVLLGVVMAAVLGAANAYLGLKAGMTVAATFPAAVIAMAVLRPLKGTILEENIARTTGAVGEALAAGAIFTIPAFVLTGLWDEFDYLTSTAMLLVGGVLGVLLVILLRRTFMEDSTLPFPESQACTEIVKAGQRGATGAGTVFTAMGLAAAIEFFKNENGIQLIKENVRTAFGLGKGTFPVVSPTASPAFLGVGFIIGPRLGAITAAGGIFGWLLLMPVALFLLSNADPKFGESLWALLKAGDIDHLFSGISAAQWQDTYGGAPMAFQGLKAVYGSTIKMVAIGAMIVGAFFTLFRMRKNLSAGIRRSLRGLGGGAAGSEGRTEKDLSFKGVLLAIGVMLVLMAALYYWLCQSFGVSLVTVVVMAIAGLLFAAVAGYLVAIIGSSSNPISGLTLSTLLIAAGLLVLLGMGGEKGTAGWSTGVLAVLGVATVICCVAGVAGDMIQDWKVGHNLGATPWRMEVGGLVGVVAAALVLVLPIMLLHKFGGGIGSDALPAPQAGLMANMADGIISGAMPWELIVMGMFFAVALILIQSPSPMLIAVGMYLPFETTLAIFVGGLIRGIVDRLAARRAGADKKVAEAVENRGLLVASGLVAGEALVGILIAGLVAMGIKLLPDDGFTKKVEAARQVMTAIQVESETPDARAGRVNADPNLLKAVLAAEGMGPAELQEAVAKPHDLETMRGKIAVLETRAGTTLVGAAPTGLYGGWRPWLGLLVILGLAFYLIRTALGALKGRREGGGGESAEAPAAGGDPPQSGA